jgi:hypothetical protein
VQDIFETRTLRREIRAAKRILQEETGLIGQVSNNLHTRIELKVQTDATFKACV